ncbi:hypothetical protein FKM82_027542 [Ascaphus truei]
MHCPSTWIPPLTTTPALHIYPEQGHPSGAVDLKLPLLCLRVVAERGATDVDMPQGLGILGALEVIEVAPSGVQHKPAILEASQGSFPGELGQETAEPGGLFLGGFLRWRGVHGVLGGNVLTAPPTLNPGHLYRSDPATASLLAMHPPVCL